MKNAAFIIMIVCVDFSGYEAFARRITPELFQIYRNDVGYIWTSTLKRKNDLAAFSFLFGTSLLVDKDVRKWVGKHQNRNLEKAADIFNVFGKGYYMFPSILTFSLIGYYTEDKKLFEASIASLEAGLTAGVATVGLKIISGRERPSFTNNPFIFKPGNVWRNRFHSFPSGDVAIAWSMITPYAVCYNLPILYLLPLSVNFARIYKNEHWLSDTVAASGLGFVIGYFTAENHLQRNLDLVFDGKGVEIVYKFN